MKTGPIIIIDDDLDDLDLIKEALLSLKVKNKIIQFDNAIAALHFLGSTNDLPFFILCDLNMPQLKGVELRQRLYDNLTLQIQTVPFLLMSSSDIRHEIFQAYELSVQGYFVKPSTTEELQTLLENIISYWSFCSWPYFK